MARTSRPEIEAADRRVIGALLRDVRRAAGYRSVETAAGTKGCPASRQTIYAYERERGGLVPTLRQFLDLIEFYVLTAPRTEMPDAKAEDDLRALGVTAVTRALALPAYHVAAAADLISRMQPEPGGTS